MAWNKDLKKMQWQVVLWRVGVVGRAVLASSADEDAARRTAVKLAGRDWTTQHEREGRVIALEDGRRYSWERAPATRGA